MADRRSRPAPSPLTDFGAERLAATIGGAVTVIGSFGPWATARSEVAAVARSGIEGDGIATAVAGALVVVLVLLRQHLSAAVVSGFALVLTIYDIADVARIADEVDAEVVRVSTDWGIWLTAAGSAAGLAGALVAWRRRPSTG